MKHSQLKQLIKEEIRSVLNEGLFNSGPEKRYDGYAKKEILKIYLLF